MTNFLVASETFGDRESNDQIVPTKRQFNFSASMHSMLSKEVSSTTSSSSIDTPLHSPGLAIAREHEPKRLETIAEKRLAIAKPFKVIPLIVKPKVAPIKVPNTIVPIAESILSKLKIRSIATDLAYFHGRRFKVGWSHANQLTVLTTSMATVNANQLLTMADAAPLFCGRGAGDSSKSVIKHIKLYTLEPIGSSAFLNSIENHLQCQLKFSARKSIDDSDCPYYVARDGIEALQEHYQLAQQNYHEKPSDGYHKIASNVWSLCVALWGFQEELEDIAADQHAAIMQRRQLLSKWLEQTITEKDATHSQESASGYLPHLMKLLTSHKVDEACDLAFNNADMNLALLLSQAGGNNVVRALVAKQLGSWYETESDKFIDMQRIKALMLTAGTPTYESSKGTVNIYEHLDWITCLAVSNFFLLPPLLGINFDHNFCLTFVHLFPIAAECLVSLHAHCINNRCIAQIRGSIKRRCCATNTALS